MFHHHFRGGKKRTIKVAMPDGTWLTATLPQPGVIAPSPTTTRPPPKKPKPFRSSIRQRSGYGAKK